LIDDIQRYIPKDPQPYILAVRSKSGLTREFFVMFTEFEIEGEAEEPYVDVFRFIPTCIALAKRA
jgi:hypothetical protein